MALQASYLDLEMPELVEHLLRQTGHDGKQSTNPAAILDFLNLTFVVVDLAALLPGQKKRPRGVLSYHDRIVGVDASLTDVQRSRFTTLHEIGHYVLPTHQNDLYVCDEQDLSFAAKIEVEREANAFASELLFQGDRFTREANDFDLNPESIKLLADQFDASYEATTRRFVERKARPCSLAVFARNKADAINTKKQGRWQFSYSVASPEFRSRYSRAIFGDVPEEVIKDLVVPGRNFADSIDNEVRIRLAGGDDKLFQVCYFTNQYSVFALVQPSKTEE